MNPYTSCHLCPRDCGVNRTAGKLGVCGETAACRIASMGPHFGEEPCFSGTRGSGTIFFAGCASHCFFCQNYQISSGDLGGIISPENLLRQTQNLIDSGVHNINFVTPSHFWPHVEHLCSVLQNSGATIPFIFNDSGYQREDMIPVYARYMDIFMPDFKFADPGLAALCMRDEKYPDIALRALRAMVKGQGFIEPWDPTGKVTATHGVLVRHLVLPCHLDNSRAVLKLLYNEFGPDLPLSIMSQFHPVPECHARGRLTRRLTKNESDIIHEWVYELGFRRAFVQELPEAGDPFFPDFEKDEPFEGNR